MNYLYIFNEHISEIPSSGFHMEKEMLVINICKMVTRMFKCEENHVMKIPKVPDLSLSYVKVLYLFSVAPGRQLGLMGKT